MALDTAGHLAVAGLHALRSLPPALPDALLPPLLPAYPLLRPAQARRLEALFAASPFADRLTLAGYYRRRLDLLLAAVRTHGAPSSPIDVEVEGGHRYREALESGRPVALLGLHMGAAELLHRVPAAPAGRPFRILTAPAFAPPLTRWLREGREAGGKRILENRGMGKGLREVLAGRGVLAFMVDQHPGRPEARARLWGRIEVPVPARLVRLLAERSCVLLPVSTRQVAARGGRAVPIYRFHAPWDPREIAGGDGGPGAMAPAPGAVPAGTDPGVARAVARIRGFLEEAISAAPDQWNWSYPKYRTVAGD